MQRTSTITITFTIVGEGDEIGEVAAAYIEHQVEHNPLQSPDGSPLLIKFYKGYQRINSIYLESYTVGKEGV